MPIRSREFIANTLRSKPSGGPTFFPRIGSSSHQEAPPGGAIGRSDAIAGPQSGSSTSLRAKTSHHTSQEENQNNRPAIKKNPACHPPGVNATPRKMLCPHVPPCPRPPMSRPPCSPLTTFCEKRLGRSAETLHVPRTPLPFPGHTEHATPRLHHRNQPPQKTRLQLSRQNTPCRQRTFSSETMPNFLT